MQKFDIRPHHVLCTGFFKGEGYSDEFTKNMAEKTAFLRNNNPTVIITDSYDIICRNCPHINSDCGSKSKASGYDNEVVRICGLKYGTEISWNKFQKITEEKIIKADLLGEICKDCQWYYICSETEYCT